MHQYSIAFNSKAQKFRKEMYDILRMHLNLSTHEH